MKIKSLIFSILILCGASSLVHADENSTNDPVGTWLLTIAFPAAPPFNELLSLHHRGTVSETNATLNANISPFSPLVLTASDGYGVWERASHGTIRFTFLKLVFCGEGFGPAEAAMGCAFTNQHIGYLRVRTQGRITGDHFEGGASSTELLIGNDPDTAMVVNLGMAESYGQRIGAESP